MDFETELKKVLDDLWRCARFLMKNEADASELFQNTVLLALKFSRKHKETNISNFKKWIISILFNEGKKLYNKKKERSLEELIEEPQDISRNNPYTINISIGFIYDSIKENLSGVVQKALERLNHQQREILLAVDILNYNYKEVAQILDIPIGTVMSNLDRARKRLKFLLANSFYKLKQ